MTERDPKEVSRLAREMTKKLAAEGRIIEGGWAGYRMLMNAAAGETQVEETRMAFYAGAHHLFASIMTMLDPEKEPTEKDCRRCRSSPQSSTGSSWNTSASTTSSDRHQFNKDWLAP